MYVCMYVCVYIYIYIYISYSAGVVLSELGRVHGAVREPVHGLHRAASR